jgi:hypothetical protein
MHLDDQPTSGRTAPSNGLPTLSRRRNVGIRLPSPNIELKKLSFDMIGVFVVGLMT